MICHNNVLTELQHDPAKSVSNNYRVGCHGCASVMDVCMCMCVIEDVYKINGVTRNDKSMILVNWVKITKLKVYQLLHVNTRC